MSERAYDENISNLSVCVSDVSSIASSFQPHYDSVQVITDNTTTNPPTRANILSALGSLVEIVDENDLILFYFSGHGVAINQDSYLLPCDARLSAIRHTSIAMRDIREMLNECPAKAKVIVLDACHSGASIGKAGAVMTAEFMQNVFADAQGIAIISSCKQGQYSWEWKHKDRSVFTHYFIEAIQGNADLDSKGFVTVSDVNRYVSDKVKLWALSHQLPQTPTLQYTVAGDIIIFQYRSAI